MVWFQSSKGKDDSSNEDTDFTSSTTGKPQGICTILIYSEYNSEKSKENKCLKSLGGWKLMKRNLFPFLFSFYMLMVENLVEYKNCQFTHDKYAGRFPSSERKK